MTVPLIVPTQKVALKLGKTTSSLTAEERETIDLYIEEAQADVENEIGRPIVPQVRTLTGRYPARHDLALTDAKTWDLYEELDDVYAVQTAQPALNGSYTLTVAVGLDGSKEAAIVRFVVAHAEAAIRANASLKMGSEREVKSASAEGQSLSWESSKVKAGDAGAGPTLASLRPYKRYSIYKRDTGVTPPWPHNAIPVGYDPRT